ncbi:hypothetical protein [uncultured Aquabacterium sp.]|uniref:N-acyl amino acid synthase FeeM domain-containing protein n=1 Tax=uncultured Aquabacterium sp. TaxID=158753 RepID=UPI002622C5F7|nr:hypothetical protein [uncultured Aquabacterium sp.]
MAASSPLAPPHGRPYSMPPLCTERLPFRVRLARDERDLARIAALRVATYGKHVPSMVPAISAPEPEDRRPDTLLLMAESRASGELLGAARMIHNGFQPLKIEQDFDLRSRFQHRFVAEAGRLTVVGRTESRMAALALVKAMYEICAHSQVDDAVITARSPMDRVYLAMRFDDLLHGNKKPFPPVGHLPHGVYLMPILEADARWRESACPMYPFMALTLHPDIEIDYQLVEQCFQHPARSTYRPAPGDVAEAARAPQFNAA